MIETGSSLLSATYLGKRKNGFFSGISWLGYHPFAAPDKQKGKVNKRHPSKTISDCQVRKPGKRLLRHPSTSKTSRANRHLLRRFPAAAQKQHESGLRPGVGGRTMTVTSRASRGLSPGRPGRRPEAPGDPNSGSFPSEPFPRGSRGTRPGSGRGAAEQPAVPGVALSGVWGHFLANGAVCPPLSGFLRSGHILAPKASRLGSTGGVHLKCEKQLLQRLAESHATETGLGRGGGLPGEAPSGGGGLLPSPESPPPARTLLNQGLR